jgi:REP element-mobilizing transposase RayT
MRVRRRLPSLRRQTIFAEIRGTFPRTGRSWFRLVHFSVQDDHVHLIVEADDTQSLGRGMAGVAIRIARAANRVLLQHQPSMTIEAAARGHAAQ